MFTHSFVLTPLLVIKQDTVNLVNLYYYYYYYCWYLLYSWFCLLLLIILFEFCADLIFAYWLKIECSIIRNQNFYSYNFLVAQN